MAGWAEVGCSFIHSTFYTLIMFHTYSGESNFVFTHNYMLLAEQGPPVQLASSDTYQIRKYSPALLSSYRCHLPTQSESTLIPIIG